MDVGSTLRAGGIGNRIIPGAGLRFIMAVGIATVALAGSGFQVQLGDQLG